MAEEIQTCPYGVLDPGLFQTLYLGSASVLYCLVIICVFFLTGYFKWYGQIYNYLSVKHYLIGLLQLLCVTLDYSTLLCEQKNLLKYFIYYLDLVILLWSQLMSCLVYLQLFLFGFDYDIYNKVQVNIFIYLSAVIVFFYEQLLLYIIFDLIEESSLGSAVRLTSLLLITCISPTVFCLTFLYLFRKNRIFLKFSIFFLFHLFVFIVSDFGLIWHFIVINDSNEKWMETTVTQKRVATLLLCIRLFVEEIWFIFSHDFVKRHIKLAVPRIGIEMKKEGRDSDNENTHGENIHGENIHEENTRGKNIHVKNTHKENTHEVTHL